MRSVAKQPERQICIACAAYTERGGYPGLCARCEAIVLAADALLDGGYNRESMIVATLAFAAYATEDVRIGELRNTLASVEQGSEVGQCLRNRLTSVFESVSVWDVCDGVPIVWRDPMQVSYESAPEDSRFVDGVGDRQQTLEKAGRVCVEVLEVSVKPEEVTAGYRKALEMFGLEEGPSEEGSIGWQSVPGIIQMTVHPSWTDPSGNMILRHIRNGIEGERLSFPKSELVGEMYAVLRGSKRKNSFRGVGYGLAGKRTKQPEAKTAVPACAAWFLAGEEARPDYATKVRITDILNKQLLSRHGLEVVYAGASSFVQLWGDVKKHEPALKRLKRSMPESLLHSEFIEGYFSARDISGRRTENK